MLQNNLDAVGAQAKIEPLAVGKDGLIALLGGEQVSSVTLWRWEKAGMIDRVPGTRRKLWTVASIRRMVSAKMVAS